MVAAWEVLGMLDIDHVPWWAAQWLVDGHDGPALRELGGLGAHDSSVHDLLPLALAETGVDLIDWLEHAVGEIQPLITGERR